MNVKTERQYQFPLLDKEKVLARSKMTPGERILTMLEEREKIVEAIRVRLRQEYPDLSPREINLKMLEEIERMKEAEDRAYAARINAAKQHTSDKDD
jgi:hypothetical protein